MAWENPGASGYSGYISVSSENSEWWYKMYSDHHGTLSSEMSCCICLGILYLHVYKYAYLQFAHLFNRWLMGERVYIVLVIYRESKMEPDATAGNELYFEFSWDKCHATSILLLWCQKFASEILYAQWSPANQLRAPRLHSSQFVCCMPRQVHYLLGHFSVLKYTSRNKHCSIVFEINQWAFTICNFPPKR